MGRSQAWEDVVGAPETDPTIKNKIRRMIQEQSEQATLERAQGTMQLANLAYVALLRNPGWRGTPREIVSVLEDLGQEGYVLLDYKEMDDEQLSSYFERCVKADIGTQILIHLPLVARDIMGRNIEARKV